MATETTKEPILVDLGKRTKREIDRLRKGRGVLMDEVDDCLQELLSAGTVSKSAQPVIIVVTEKAKRVMPVFMPPPFPFAFTEEDEDDEDEDEDEDDED